MKVTPNPRQLRAGMIGALLIAAATMGRAEPAKVDDPLGILKKPIPERLVVFTFDDGCASHATIAAPILKKYGFNGTFYVSDAYLFRERKDWYMTWRQIRTMSEQGFEIGNHTRGHGQLSMTDVGGCQAYVWTLEDEMIANRIPRSTTFCWPFYDTNPKFYPLLQSWGYTFARGGHGRTYDPTKDNPFDVPSFAAGGVGQTLEGMISAVQQATAGKVVVITFHGTPDMEHAGVGIDPDLFEDLVEYLKDNNYKVIAMRDLVEYIDPANAAKLPPTREKLENTDPPPLVKGDKPYVPKKRERRGYEFPKELTGPWTVKEIYRLHLPDGVSTSINGTTITMYVPATTDVKTLAPVFELARFATADPASGTARDFTNPQIYKITAQDGSTKDYTVKAVPTAVPMHFTWTAKDGGNFADGTNWNNNLGAVAGPGGGGNADTILNFNAPGRFTVTRGDEGDFVLNQLNFTGSALTYIGKGNLVFTKSRSSDLPYMNSQTRAEVTIKAPIRLDADLTIDGLELDDTRVFLPDVISGAGALIKNGPHTLYVSNPINTYSGGTIVNEGSLSAQKQGLGTGPVTINNDGAIGIGGDPVMNPLTANGGRIFSGGNGRWSGPVTLKGNTLVSSPETLEFDNKESGISGPGGITQTGHRVDHGTKSGTIKLSGHNTYTGATKVEMGLMEVVGSLYNNEPAQWTPANITVNGAAGELRLHVGGPDAFTAAQAGEMLRNLTTNINQNGLLARSTFGMDTTGATEVQELGAAITDSQGSGGGGIHLKKCGAGTLKLSGANTYSGQTIVEGGALSVESLNSLKNGNPSSSLGAPRNESDGEIFLSGGCTLIYTGKGETTDRTLNFPGHNDTISLDQSGTGLWKITSPFVISGYGENKTIILTGSSTGTGEIACDIEDPYDRKDKATTSLTKAGPGTWTLSGTNTYTGPTKVIQGTLSLANARSLGEEAEIAVSEGAMLEANFAGEMRVGKLNFDGMPQPAGTYDAKSAPRFIKGSGVLKNSATPKETNP
ncbi:MAG: autotransporter-associated beta strand repeat-containing protein [Akkermansiaceae bacterium]